MRILAIVLLAAAAGAAPAASAAPPPPTSEQATPAPGPSVSAVPTPTLPGRPAQAGVPELPPPPFPELDAKAVAAIKLPAPTRAMTLQEALDYARVNQPSLVAARARLVGVQAEAGIPRALYLPRVAATAQLYEGTTNNTTGRYTATYGLDLPRVGATAVGTTSWNPTASSLAGIGLRQEIFDFGRIAALEQAADAAVEAESGFADAMRLDVIYAVEKSYYAVQTAKGVLGAADAAYRRSKLNFDTATAGVRVGLRDPIELTRAESDLARFDVARVRARAGLTAAQGVYAAVVGVPDTLLDSAGAPAPPPPSPELADAFTRALANDPILRERQARTRQQEAQTRAIAAELRPDISLTTTLMGGAGGATPTSGTLTSGSGFLPNVPNWDAGLVFTWPLLDFGVKARENASQALESARKAEVREQIQRLNASVQSAYVGFLAAEQALPALEKTYRAATANYEQAEARFKHELGSSVELADAQALLTAAEVDVTIGRFEVLKTRAGLARAIAENL